MEVKTYFTPSDEATLRNIQKDLNEDPERLKRQVQLFEEWIRCEPHLPKDIDKQLIVNFVRFCKCNLDTAKRKFENYLAARIKWRQSSLDPVFDEEYFSGNETYRQCAAHPKLTPDGYRVCYQLIHTADKFNFEQTLRHILTLIDLFFFESSSSGIICIIDSRNVTTEHIQKVNLKYLLVWLNIIFNVSPLRVKNIHMLHMPKVAETIFNIALKSLNKKMYHRVIVHKDIEGLSTYLPEYFLLDEYGGKGGKFDLYSEMTKDFLLGNDDFTGKIAALKLAGPIPSNKTDIYSFEEFGMEGSFRQLNLD